MPGYTKGVSSFSRLTTANPSLGTNVRLHPPLALIIPDPLLQLVALEIGQLHLMGRNSLGAGVMLEPPMRLEGHLVGKLLHADGAVFVVRVVGMGEEADDWAELLVAVNKTETDQ